MMPGFRRVHVPRPLSFLLPLRFAGIFLLCCCLAHSGPANAEGGWPEELQTHHWPGAYWWAPASAWRESDIDFNLRTMAEAGIRNVHIVPIYGANGYEDRFIDYLSPEWMRMLDYIVRAGASLDMNVDMTTGTGWCFGGPGMEGALADTILTAGEDGTGHALKPGRLVKRAAPGGEGMMLNPYSPAAMRQYLERFSRAFDTPTAARPRAQYHDSFEYQGNWPEELPRAFVERRGYDLVPRLPELLDPTTDPELRARLKYDYRITLAELHAETMQVWIDWCRERGMLTRNQAHGSPTNLLDLYAACDIPETEMFGAPEYPIPGFRLDPALSREGDTDVRVCMMASSAAHIAHEPGKQLVSAEACTWLREHWNTNLGQVKLQLDRFFLAGINHIFYHGTCFSPEDAPWPGWYFYASTKFDWRNAFWRDLPHINAYVARCQSVLQAGAPANDVLLYWPIHDLWSAPDGLELRMSVHEPRWMADSNLGALSQRLMDRGYTFDFVSDDLLAQVEFRDASLRSPGAEYRAIVVPKCQYLPPETLERLATLAGQGATVLFEDAIPEEVPGLGHREARLAALATARQRARDVAGVASDILPALDRAGVRREPLVDTGLQYIRRRVDGGHYYFIVNHSASSWDGWLPLATEFQAATLHDPMTGDSGGLALAERDGHRAVYLQLEAGAAAIIRTHAQAHYAPRWTYLTTSGAGIPVAEPWELTFLEGEPSRPEKTTLRQLGSWTEHPGGAAVAFAGTGRYTTHFTLPQHLQADDWILDLGEVRESARVYLNGQHAGTLVALPFRLRIGPWLHPGENTLSIEVTNLSANRIRALAQETDDWKIMRDINIVTVDYTEFRPQDWAPAESGLIGPVQLFPMTTHEPTP